jgi:ankyrin repeat protein
MLHATNGLASFNILNYRVMRQLYILFFKEKVIFFPFVLLYLLNCSSGEFPEELFTAIKAGNLGEADRLLLQGAAINEKDQHGAQALHHAVKKGNSKMVKLLLNYLADIEAADEWGKTPLWLATERGYKTIVKRLLTYGVDVNQRLYTGETALHIAIKQDQLLVAKVLLDAGANVSVTDYHLFTPLHTAVATNKLRSVAMVNYLLEKNANLEAETKEAVKPIHLASNARVLEILLKKGASPNAITGKGEPILHTYIEQKNTACANLLLQYKADITLKDREAETVLHKAARNIFNQTNLFSLVTECVSYHIDVDAKNQWGQTPLHVAAYNGNLAMICILLSFNADVNAKDKAGWTPLHKALRCWKGIYCDQDKELDRIRLLLHNKANVNEKDNFGRTPLHHAADYVPNDEQGLRIIELLLNNNADRSLEDDSGCSAESLLTHKLRMINL